MRQYKEHGNVSLFDTEITLQKLWRLLKIALQVICRILTSSKSTTPKFKE